MCPNQLGEQCRERKREKTISQHDYLIWSNDFSFCSNCYYWFACYIQCSNVEQILHTAFHCVTESKRIQFTVRRRKKDSPNVFHPTIECWREKNRFNHVAVCKFVVFAVCLLWGMSEQWVVAFITKPTSLMWEKSTFHYPRHSTSNEKTLVTLCLWAINKLKVIIDGMTRRKLRKRGILIVENLTDKWAFIAPNYKPFIKLLEVIAPTTRLFVHSSA